LFHLFLVHDKHCDLSIWHLTSAATLGQPCGVAVTIGNVRTL
jgi:hypothetical protein